MMLIALLLFGLVIYFLFYKKETNIAAKTPQTMDALEMAKVRLAKGEISVEEFEMIKKSIM